MVLRPLTPTRRTPLRRRTGLAAGVVAVAALLASCGDGVGPGVAAQVGDDEISLSTVDDLATVICATQSTDQSGQKAPTASVRSVALNVLMQIAVAKGLGDLADADQQQLAQNLQGVEQARDALPRKYRGLFDRTVRDYARAQIVVGGAAAKAVSASGGDPADQQAVAAAQAKLQTDYLAREGVAVSPRFGTFTDGRLVGGDGSLSVPVSEVAKSFLPSTDDPSGATSSGDYPASQRCS